MTRTRGEVWFFAALGLSVTVAQLLMLRSELWPQLWAIDWFILALLLASPLFALWSHIGNVGEISDDVWKTGIRLALGGYVPLWFGLGLVGRVLNR
jgi:hypothetical protein